MTEKRDVAVLVGSLRAASWTRKVAKALIALAPETLAFRFVEIGDLALYNEELETNVPASWAKFRDEMASAEAVLFATPEYNRSVPGLLKNAIDVGSRPYGKSVWDHKPAAVVSVSPGAMGGFGANHHLRQSLVFLNMPVLQQPEAYIGGAAKLLDEAGAPLTDGTRDYFKSIMTAFAAWVETNRHA